LKKIKIEIKNYCVEMEFDTTENKIVFFVGSCLVWSAICAFVESTITFKSLVPKMDHDVKNRFVSIMHGLLTLFLSGYSIFVDRSAYTDKNSDVQHFALLVSMGYFVYDFIACNYYDISDRSLVIHHSLAIFGYFMSEYYDNSTISMAGLFYAEISNSFMHLRAILRAFGKRYTLAYEAFDLAYIVVYVISRGIFVTVVVYETILVSDIPLLLRLTCTALWIQSLFFIVEMVGILKRKKKQWKERSKKGIHYQWLSENPEELKKLSYFKKEVKETVF
jgi:hypothetical protein